MGKVLTIVGVLLMFSSLFVVSKMMRPDYRNGVKQAADIMVRGIK
jgi:hypothetical protein